MGDKTKKTFMFIRLLSAAGTGSFDVKRKIGEKLLEKLEFRPIVNRHLLFTNQKMSSTELEQKMDSTDLCCIIYDEEEGITDI
ncbi:PREDICTED: uncharacterized protein LOC104802731 [Tarenaya hassleriana]|uniref:uncharacterized protein LOC104802731 n=1 Tax=Tarenaya hassleriana TaxID=28532 RepID=UPI0008FD2D0F|nr:PREDICTED: uncharacterized protein LOC104802731 [Tarenaya hassleriana]